MPYKIYSANNPVNQKLNPKPFRLSQPRYCQQDITGFYTIDATLNPLQDLVNYCQQDITGFYTIDATLNPLQDLVNYCPQNNTGFYDFAQAP